MKMFPLSYGFLASVFICLVCINTSNSRVINTVPKHKAMRGFVEGDTGTTDWWQTGQDELIYSIEKTLKITQQIRKAKNVILFIGDGMGISTVSAARIYHAQSRQLMGYDAQLAFEKFPYVALSKTYNTDSQVPDSAGTATAYTCGYKAKKGTIGVNQNVFLGECDSLENNKVKSFLSYAMEQNKWGGLVTTTRITHATPAAAYAHAGDRDWECDADVPSQHREKCPDIAWQLVHSEENKNIKVILGGGRLKFMGENQTDPEYVSIKGERQDGRDLIQEWIAEKAERFGENAEKYKYIFDDAGFNNTDEKELEYLLGLFEPGHMKYESERQQEPSLKEMITKAIKILQKSENGFALLVEGGRIDHAHHDSWAANAMIETVALSDAVQAAVDLTDESDTLIVVTADHSHVLAFNGYPYISNDILGLVREENEEHTGTELVVMDDGKPYLALAYANGPGFSYHRQVNGSEDGEEMPRRDLANEQGIGAPFYWYDTGMLRGSETHGGEDVGIYARGPMSHLFHGVQEQNYIAHVMMYAACIGPNTDHCDKPHQYPECPTKDSGVLITPLNSFMLVCLTMVYKVL